MDQAGLWTNIGIFVATAGAAAVAWWQALAAASGKKASEHARDEAVRAQVDAAAALDEIVRVSKDTVARAQERHLVRWVVGWVNGPGRIYNSGPDAAYDVRVIVTEDDWQPDPFTREVVKQGGFIDIPWRDYIERYPEGTWRIEWRSALGRDHVLEGSWKQSGAGG